MLAKPMVCRLSVCLSIVTALLASSAPIPSAACQVQILPIAPDLISIQTSAAGSWSASFTVPAGLPADLFGQIAIVDGGGFVVSNPIQTHIL